MTFYSDEVTRLTKSLYPHDDLTKHIIQSKFYIDKRFSENINLGKIAAKAMVSKFHFIRVFKKYYGRTPNQYLQEVRIEKAKQLLKKEKRSMKLVMLLGSPAKLRLLVYLRKGRAKLH